MSLQRSHGWRWLLLLGIVWGTANLYCQTPKFQDTIWEGNMQVRIPELARYAFGIKKSSMKGVQIVDLPFEIWFPSETTFCVIYLIVPPFRVGKDDQAGCKYLWVLGAIPRPTPLRLGAYFGDGSVNKIKRTLLGTGGSMSMYPSPYTRANARYAYQKNKSGETLTINGMANILYQREDPQDIRYLLDPRPATITYSGVFTKTGRLVSVESPKTGKEGFGDRSLVIPR
jgi:hypothetical protein